MTLLAGLVMCSKLPLIYVTDHDAEQHIRRCSSDSEQLEFDLMGLLGGHKAGGSSPGEGRLGALSRHRSSPSILESSEGESDAEEERGGCGRSRPIPIAGAAGGRHGFDDNFDGFMEQKYGSRRESTDLSYAIPHANGQYYFGSTACGLWNDRFQRRDDGFIDDEDVCEKCLADANEQLAVSSSMIAKPVYFGSFDFRKFTEGIKVRKRSVTGERELPKKKEHLLMPPLSGFESIGKAARNVSALNLDHRSHSESKVYDLPISVQQELLRGRGLVQSMVCVSVWCVFFCLQLLLLLREKIE